MALSMDEQRMLAEIERRLAAEDPGLAARLSSFRRPGPAARLRSTRARVMGTLLAVALMAVVSLMIYAMVPFRAHIPKTTTTLTPQASTSAPARAGTPAPAKTDQVKATSPRTTTASKTTASKTKTTAKTGSASS